MTSFKVEDLLSNSIEFSGRLILMETSLPRQELRQRFFVTLAVYGLFLGLPVALVVAGMLAPHSPGAALAIIIAIEFVFLAYAIKSELASAESPWKETTWLDMDQRCWVRERIFENLELTPIQERIAFDEAVIFCQTIHFEVGVGFAAGLIRKEHIKRFEDIDAFGNFHELLYCDDEKTLESAAEILAGKLQMPCIKQRVILPDLINCWDRERKIARLNNKKS